MDASSPIGVNMALRKKRKRPIYQYTRKRIPVKEITSATIDIVATQIVKNNMSRHQRKRHNYNGKFNLTTLTKVIHNNHTVEIHDSIMENHIDISYVNLYYGNKEVRVESNGSIMAIVLYCRNIPRVTTSPRGWKSIVGNNKIVLYTKGDSLISGDVRLFRYSTPLRVYRAEVIGAEETLHYANINIEGVDYWEYLKGYWETMDSVHWENYKATF